MIEDRYALRELVESYALAVDQADAAAVAALFTPDGDLVLFMDPGDDRQTGLRHGREEITAALQSLRRYRATHHTVSAHSSAVDGDRATAETRCEAHHVEGSHDRVLYLHYLDRYRKVDDRWWFSRREVHARWATTVPVDG